MQLRRSVIILAAVMAIGSAGTAFGTDAPAPVDFNTEGIPVKETRIEEGITVDGIDVSGMTVEEMERTLREHYRQLAASSLTLDVKESSAVIGWNRLGYTTELDPVLEEAAALGQGSGIIGKYEALTDMNISGQALTVPYSVDEKAVRDFVSGIELHEGEPVNASITRENGEFVITPQINGYDMDVETTVKTIMDLAAAGIRGNMKAEGSVSVTEPEIKTEDLECIKDVLGTCTTDVSGTDARYNNVKVGSGNINGHLLMPGDSASTSDMMLPRSPENGYRKAPQYVDGHSEDAYGGGVCQVSSTLYNALLRAEIQIDERHPHSMKVSYIEPSLDAAISAGFKDMRFTNNLDHPIYLEAKCSDRRLTFTVYGCETRDTEHRKVVYESHTTYSHQDPDKEVPDPTQPVGYREAVGDRHPVTKSYAEKVVYIDGEEVSRERINSDYYSGSVKTVTVGTMVVNPEPVNPDPLNPTVPTDPTAPTEPAAPVTDPGTVTP